MLPCLLRPPAGPLLPLLLTTPKGRARSSESWAPIPGTHPISITRIKNGLISKDGLMWAWASGSELGAAWPGSHSLRTVWLWDLGDLLGEAQKNKAGTLGRLQLTAGDSGLLRPCQLRGHPSGRDLDTFQEPREAARPLSPVAPLPVLIAHARGHVRASCPLDGQRSL